MERGAWWAAVYGVAQRRTRLKRLSSSRLEGGASQVVLVVKNPSANAGDIRDTGSIPEWERCPGVGMATTPGFLPGESPWTEEPGGLQSMGSQRVGHDSATKLSTAH